MSAYAAYLDPATAKLTMGGEVAAFITPRALVSVRKDERFDGRGSGQRWDSGDQATDAGGDTARRVG